MEFNEVLKARRSVRKYKQTPIPEDVMKRILMAARYAPSAENIQPWMFIVVRDEEIKREIATYSHGQKFIAEAPVIIVALGNLDESTSIIGGYMPSYPIDVAIAVEHIVLAAANEGLGTCWIGDFKEEKICSILNIPEEYHVVALTPIGYPSDEEKPRSGRKSLGDIVRYDRYSD